MILIRPKETGMDVNKEEKGEEAKRLRRKKKNGRIGKINELKEGRKTEKRMSYHVHIYHVHIYYVCYWGGTSLVIQVFPSLKLLCLRSGIFGLWSRFVY